jgi:hypothetical protein
MDELFVWAFKDITKDPDAIPLLLRLLDDNSNSEDIAMQRLAYGIESFHEKDYIPALPMELKKIFARALQECSYFFYRIFNTPQLPIVLKENMHFARSRNIIRII